MGKTLFAFYGSLRRGMRLHKQFKDELHYQYSAWLRGFDLYSLGNYPYCVISADQTHKILVEIVLILDPEIEKSIRKIESDAGYFVHEVQLGNDRLIIFLFEEPTNNLRVDSGDWCIFFGQ